MTDTARPMRTPASNPDPDATPTMSVLAVGPAGIALRTALLLVATYLAALTLTGDALLVALLLSGLGCIRLLVLTYRAISHGTRIVSAALGRVAGQALDATGTVLRAAADRTLVVSRSGFRRTVGALDRANR